MDGATIVKAARHFLEHINDETTKRQLEDLEKMGITGDDRWLVICAFYLQNHLLTLQILKTIERKSGVDLSESLTADSEETNTPDTKKDLLH